MLGAMKSVAIHARRQGRASRERNYAVDHTLTCLAPRPTVERAECDPNAAFMGPLEDGLRATLNLHVDTQALNVSCAPRPLSPVKLPLPRRQLFKIAGALVQLNE